MDEWVIEEMREISAGLRRKLDGVASSVSLINQLADELEDEMAEDDGPPWVDIIDEISVNDSPTAPEAWWIRGPEQITGITIHHTLSHNPANVARYVIEEKGRPSIPYHLWVNRGGEVWLCAPLEWGMWHDHTGHRNTHISIGMAGHLHKVLPPLNQLHATARLVAYLMDEYDLGIEQVQGHNDRYASTICPGWDALNWRDNFYRLLREQIEPF